MLSEASEKFAIAREIIRHENDLVNNRVTWLLVLQGLLFTAFVNGLGLYTSSVDGRLQCAASLWDLCFMNTRNDAGDVRGYGGCAALLHGGSNIAASHV